MIALTVRQPVRRMVLASDVSLRSSPPMTDVLSAGPALPPRAGRLAGGLRLSVASTPDAVACDWHRLEAAAGASPYQAHGFLAAWSRHAAGGAGMVPRVGLVHDALGELVAILPFGVERFGPARLAGYLGGSHANLNMPLLAPGWAARLGPGGLREMVRDYAAAVGADAVVLCNQPEHWAGEPHPLLGLDRHASPFTVQGVRFGAPFQEFAAAQLSKSTRSKLRRKEAHLREAGARIGRAEDEAACRRLLDAYLAQKAKRLAAQGCDNPFAAVGVPEFLLAAARKGLEGGAGLELHGVELDGAVLAVAGGVVQGRHRSLMILSFDPEHPMGRNSPGEVLVGSYLAASAAAGAESVDFGVGSERFKDTWSNETLPLFQSTLAVTTLGRLAIGAIRLRSAAVEAVKAHPRLDAWARQAQRTLQRLRA